MHIEQLRNELLQMKGVTEGFPFKKEVLVFKVSGKIIALAPLEEWEKGNPFVNLKCDPEYAIKLREQYESICPGYHMNKKHWNSVYLSSGELTITKIQELLQHSYDMVYKNLSKKQQADLL